MLTVDTCKIDGGTPGHVSAIRGRKDKVLAWDLGGLRNVFAVGAYALRCYFECRRKALWGRVEAGVPGI